MSYDQCKTNKSKPYGKSTGEAPRVTTDVHKMVKDGYKAFCERRGIKKLKFN